jgi:hypothetical protein
MNTFRIYEDFKGSLGDAAAKSLAQTLGAMFEELRDTVSKEDFRGLRESIDTNVSRLEAATIRLTEAQGRTEARMAELAEGQQRLTVAQTEMVVALQRLTIRTDAVVGRTFELQFRDRLTAYLGQFLRRGKLISNDELLEAIEPHVADREVDDFLRADAVAKGIVDGRPAYVVVEVSATGDVEEIVRAERRAAVLRKAGLESIPLVACDAISPESLAFAKQASVRVWCNGSMVDAA